MLRTEQPWGTTAPLAQLPALLTLHFVHLSPHSGVGGSALPVAPRARVGLPVVPASAVGPGQLAQLVLLPCVSRRAPVVGAAQAPTPAVVPAQPAARMMPSAPSETARTLAAGAAIPQGRAGHLAPLVVALPVRPATTTGANPVTSAKSRATSGAVAPQRRSCQHLTLPSFRRRSTSLTDDVVNSCFTPAVLLRPMGARSWCTGRPESARPR